MFTGNVPILLRLSRTKYGKVFQPFERSSFLAIQSVKAFGTCVTVRWGFGFQSFNFPALRALIRSLKSLSEIKIGTISQRQCGCQPVQRKVLGYRPANTSQISYKVRNLPLITTVWLLLNRISYPIIRGLFW